MSRVIEDEMNEVECKSYLHLEKYISPVFRAFSNLIFKYLPDKSKIKILDLGSGTGTIPIKICQKNPNIFYTGLDISEYMIKISCDRIKDANLSNRITLKKGDAEKKLKFPDESFDMVISLHTLHNFSHPEKTIKELLRVCKKGGKVILADMLRPKKIFIKLFVYSIGIMYTKEGKKIYENSLKSSFNHEELIFLLNSLKKQGINARLNKHFITHYSIILDKD